MIGSPRTRPFLLAGVVTALATTVVAALWHETRPQTTLHRVSASVPPSSRQFKRGSGTLCGDALGRAS